MTISIWCRYDGQKPEVVDHASDKEEAGYLEYQYRMAFQCEGGRVHKPGCMVWAGRRNQEPRWEKSSTTGIWYISEGEKP